MYSVLLRGTCGKVAILPLTFCARPCYYPVIGWCAFCVLFLFKGVMRGKSIVIVVEGIILIGLCCLLSYLYPDGLIMHKTGAVADSFMSVSRVYLTCGMWGVLFLLPVCLIIPFVKRKRFIYVLEGSLIFYLYFLNALITTVVSLNVRSVFLDVLAYFLLFFIPILGLYLLIYMIVNSCGNR